MPVVPLHCTVSVTWHLQYSQAATQRPVLAIRSDFVQIHPWWSSTDISGLVTAVKQELPEIIRYVPLLFPFCGTVMGQKNQKGNGVVGLGPDCPQC